MDSPFIPESAVSGSSGTGRNNQREGHQVNSPSKYHRVEPFPEFAECAYLANIDPSRVLHQDRVITFHD
jgi:hypothetical protein